MHRIVTVGAAAAVAMALLMPGAGAQTSPAAKPVTDPAVAAAEAVAAKARSVLDAHCATCHQAGRLAGLTPGRAIGNILALDELARNPSLVQPGNPDASPLYLSMLTRRMPPEPSERAPRKEVPSSADLDAVRDWIERLPRDLGCSARKPIEAGDQKALIQRAVEQRPASRRGQLRFISLVHLYNACASEREIKGYGQAIARLLNGVSWAPLPTRLEPADETGALLVLDLAQLGWERARWETLAAVYPYADRAPDAPGAAQAAELGTEVPVIRADWLAYAAGRPPLYYDLLGLPEQGAQLLSSLNIDLAGNTLAGRARRAAIRTSAVARGGRLIERHAFANGGHWISYEFAATPGRATIFDLAGGQASATGLNHDGTHSIFTLQNGFNAFLITDPDDRRMVDTPQSILRDESAPRDRVTAGVGCLSCHGRGIQPVVDQLRAEVLASPNVVPDFRQRVLALHAEPAEMQKLVADDNTRLAKAMEAAGLDANLLIDGADPVVALVARYKRALSAREAAAELGLPMSELAAAADRAGGPDREAVQRLAAGSIGRREFEARFAGLLVAARASAKPTPVFAGTPLIGFASAPREIDGMIDLAVIPERGVLQPGDLLTIKVRASAACHLTLINVVAGGRATVIYPNDFDQSSYLETDKALVVPALNAPYQFRMREKGTENIVAICTAEKRDQDFIRHDFERQRFTELGDWRAFLAKTFAGDGDERRARRPRGRGEPGDAGARPAANEASGRTAIQVEIR